jgi:hypothetical protein
VLQQRVAAYLIDQGLLDPATIVDGELEVVQLARRHAGIQVRVGGRPAPGNDHVGYFVKHAAMPEREAALAHEAAVYAALRAPAASRVKPYLPEFVLYDPDEKLLVLKLVAPARTLREYHASSGRFATAPASGLGEALGALHTTRLRGALSSPPALPWVLRVHQPSFGFFCELSAASVQLLSVLQRSDELCGVLDELEADWSQDGFVHNDVRWDNCLVASRGATRRTRRIKLIDWELGNYGDALWDVGAALSQYLAFWLLSIPAGGDVALRELPHLARHPLDRMQPAIRAFWRHYVATRDGESFDAEAALVRATRYAAGHLVQAAIENAQPAPTLSAFGVLCLQLALNIGIEPERAAVQLLGLHGGALAH